MDPKTQFDQTRRYAFSFGLSMFLLTFACSFFSQALSAPLETLAAVGIGFAAAAMLVVFWQGWGEYREWFQTQLENMTMVVEAEPVEPEPRLIPWNFSGSGYPVNPQNVDEGESASPLRGEDVSWWMQEIKSKGHARNTWVGQNKRLPSGRLIGRGTYDALVDLAGVKDRRQGATGHL